MLMTTTIGIAEHDYVLAAGTSVSELMAQVVLAVREGGGSISFRAIGGRLLTILVSPGASIWISESEGAGPAPHQGADEPEFDLWDL